MFGKTCQRVVRFHRLRKVSSVGNKLFGEFGFGRLFFLLLLLANRSVFNLQVQRVSEYGIVTEVAWKRLCFTTAEPESLKGLINLFGLTDLALF